MYGNVQIASGYIEQRLRNNFDVVSIFSKSLDTIKCNLKYFRTLIVCRNLCYALLSSSKTNDNDLVTNVNIRTCYYRSFFTNSKFLIGIYKSTRMEGRVCSDPNTRHQIVALLWNGMLTKIPLDRYCH